MAGLIQSSELLRLGNSPAMQLLLSSHVLHAKLTHKAYRQPNCPRIFFFLSVTIKAQTMASWKSMKPVVAIAYD